MANLGNGFFTVHHERAGDTARRAERVRDVRIALWLTARGIPCAGFCNTDTSTPFIRLALVR